MEEKYLQILYLENKKRWFTYEIEMDANFLKRDIKSTEDRFLKNKNMRHNTYNRRRKTNSNNKMKS